MSLIGYWPLNEESGDTAYDHSGNENHGSLNNVDSRNRGLLGQSCYYFNGSDTYVNIGDIEEYSNSALGSSVSASGWFYPESNQGDVISHASGSNNDNFRIYWGVADNSWSSYVDAVNSTSMVWSNSPELNSWNHVSLTYNGSYQTVYLNGEVVARKTNSGSLSDATGSEWTIGSKGGDSSFFKGNISEIRLYNRPLTKSEVQYLYNVGKRGLQTTSKKTS